MIVSFQAKADVNCLTPKNQCPLHLASEQVPLILGVFNTSTLIIYIHTYIHTYIHITHLEYGHPSFKETIQMLPDEFFRHTIYKMTQISIACGVESIIALHATKLTAAESLEKETTFEEETPSSFQIIFVSWPEKSHPMSYCNTK